jgi:hypothetical protein
MKNLILFIALFTISFGIKAQKTEDKKIKIGIHGFIKTDYWYDSRQVAYAREGLFTLFPKDVNLDKFGNDINGEASFNYSAITSRLNFKFEGLEAFGAKTFGFIEADFSGASNVTTNTFRLRHAFIQLNWTNTELLMGQFWHPLFVTNVFPRVISLNTGAPFQAFNRSPQIRLTQHFGKLKLIAAVIAQRDYANFGPLGRSFSYLSNSLSPNLHLQLQYISNNNTLGLAADYKSLRPRLVSDSNIITTNTINSLSYMAYYKYQNKHFTSKTKVMFGENLSDQLMLGGYAVESIDTSNNFLNYTPTQHIFVWTNFTVNKNFNKFSLHPSLFVGYSKNLGTKADNIGIYYSTGSNIDQLIRIAPSISIKSGGTMFSLEWEYTRANYGEPQDNGTVSNTHSVSNNRLLFTGFYFF